MTYRIAIAAALAWALAIFPAILLHRTYGMREVIEPTPAWRKANDARLDAMESRLNVLTTQALEVESRADNMERMIHALREAGHGR